MSLRKALGSRVLVNLKVASFLQNQKPSYGYLFCEQPVQFPFGHAGVQADDSTMFQTWQHEHKGNYEVCEEKVVHFLSDPGHLQRGKTKWSKKHVGHLFPEGAETLPAAHSQMLGLHQVTTDLMEKLLMHSGPVIVSKDQQSQEGNQVLSQAEQHERTWQCSQQWKIQIINEQEDSCSGTHQGSRIPRFLPVQDTVHS